MSQAAELLNSLPGDNVATYTPNAEEEHIVVGSDRFIRIPDSLKRLGVQRDKDIETVTFDCPRYWDKHDLSQMVVYVNYVLPNGEDGRYPVQNVVAIGTMLHFDWTISDYVTQYQGQISFLICAVMTDEDGNEKLHWNSELNQEAYISEGLECSESPIHQYPDIITHLLTRMNEVEAIATPEAMQTYTDTWLEKNHARILAEIEAKGQAALDDIPGDYIDTYNMARESVRTKADAIVGTAKGTTISVSDSSDDHLRGLRVFGKTTQASTTGKNLLDVQENITLTNVKGIAVNIAAGKYIISLKSETHSGNLPPYIRFYDNDVWIVLKNGLSQTVELTKAETNVYIHTYGMSASESVGVTATLEQLMLSVNGGEYEPYSGGFTSPSPDWPQEMSSPGDSGNVKIWVTGKNLLRDVAFPKTHTANGIKCDYEGNGVFHVHGTFSGTTSGYQLSTSDMNIPINPDSKYTFSAKLLSGAAPDNFHPYIGAGSKTNEFKNWIALKIDPDMKVGETRSATALGGSTLKDATTIKRFWIYSWNPDMTAYVVDFRVQVWLEKSDVSTDYEPYTEQVVTLTAPDALNGVPVVSGGNYTDESGQQWVCDEIDFERGVRIERLVRATISNFEREDGPYGTRYIASGPDVAPHKDYVECLCNTIQFSTNVGSGTAWIHNGIRVSPTYQGGTFVAKYNDEVISELDIIYIRDNPVEVALTAEELEWYRNAHSNYPNTTVMNDSGAPMRLTYNVDTKTYFDSLPKATDEQVERYVHTWLDSHFTNAEGVSF